MMNDNVYRAARWAYQPFKQARYLVRDMISVSSRKAKISQYLSRPGFKGLQIGSGPNLLEGWLNSDVAGFGDPELIIDITKSLPIGADQLDAIYGSEVIEHVTMVEAEAFFAESYRTLKEGGVLRMTTPDVEAICKITLGMNEKSTIAMHAETWLEPDKELTPSIWINAMFRRWGHQHLWDFSSLQKSLTEAGFAKVELVSPQVTLSKYEQLANIDNRYGMPPEPHCWESSVLVEATK